MRRKFISLIFGLAGAAAAQDVTANRKIDTCPVCGLVASPYKLGQPNGEGLTLTTSGHQERIIRCKRCNAAFWQDAK